MTSRDENGRFQHEPKKIDLIAVDARLRTMERDTGENLNRLAQSIIDLQNQIESLQGSDRMNKEHIKRMQNVIADHAVEIAQLSDRLDNLTPKPSLFERFKNELARRFGK